MNTVHNYYVYVATHVKSDWGKASKKQSEVESELGICVALKPAYNGVFRHLAFFVGRGWTCDNL